MIYILLQGLLFKKIKAATIGECGGNGEPRGIDRRTGRRRAATLRLPTTFLMPSMSGPALSVGTMLLSCADAFLTLQLLDMGMIEANPVMQSALNRGTEFFIALKLLMTALGIFVLVFLAKAHFLNRFRTGLFLTVFFSAYACLVCYELVSLFGLM